MALAMIVVGAYLFVGIIAIVLLDKFTGRVRARLNLASFDTQEKLATTGFFVGRRMAIILTLVALWLFYPVAIYGAVSSKREDK